MAVTIHNCRYQELSSKLSTLPVLSGSRLCKPQCSASVEIRVTSTVLSAIVTGHVNALLLLPMMMMIN